MVRKIRFPGQPLNRKDNPNNKDESEKQVEKHEKHTEGKINNIVNNITSQIHQIQRKIFVMRQTIKGQSIELPVPNLYPAEILILTATLLMLFALSLGVVYMAIQSQSDIIVPVYCKIYNGQGQCIKYSSKPYTVILTAKRLQLNKPLSFYNNVECSLRYNYDSTEYNIPVNCQKTNNSITATIIPNSKYVNHNNTILHIKLIKNDLPFIIKTMNIPLGFNIKGVK